MKKYFIVFCILPVCAVILIMMYHGFLKEKYEYREIEVNYIDEIQFEKDPKEILSNSFLNPKLHSAETKALLYESYLEEIIEKAELSNEKVNDLKEKLDRIPEGAYIYLSIGKKLEYIYYSEEPGGVYGWNGYYGMNDYNSVFIYWGIEPLGNVIDGYV